MPTGQPPWHMWGNTQTLNLPGFTIPAGDTVHNVGAADQSQLCDVRYLRPDTWRFLLQAKLLLAPDISDLGADGNASIDVSFDLIAGVGRSNIIIPDFATLSFSWLGTEPVPYVVLFTASGKGAESYTGGSFADRVAIEEITAQSIQLQARAFITVNRASSDNPDIITAAAVSCSAHFAPNVHVRPEWHMEQFNGEEQGPT